MKRVYISVPFAKFFFCFSFFGLLCNGDVVVIPAQLLLFPRLLSPFLLPHPLLSLCRSISLAVLHCGMSAFVPSVSKRLALQNSRTAANVSAATLRVCHLWLSRIRHHSTWHHIYYRYIEHEYMRYMLYIFHGFGLVWVSVAQY